MSCGKCRGPCQCKYGKKNVTTISPPGDKMLLVDNPFSTYDYKYAVTQTQPDEAEKQAIWGLVQMGLSEEAARMYSQVVVSKTTRACRKSEGGFKDVNTELWGTSPYLGRGDGEVFNMPTSNQLMRGFDSSLRGSKSRAHIDEKSFIPYTWEYMDIPLAVTTTDFVIGLNTRQQPAYSEP